MTRMNIPIAKTTIGLVALVACFVLATTQTFAQGKQRVLQFSGIVVGGEDSEPVAGAHMYIPRAGRGTSTNPYGFFSMPVMSGDSIIISSVGYKKQFYIIPQKSEKGYSVVIELLTDTTMLPVVEVYPYPTEELFKEAFLALQLPDEQDQEAMRKNLNQRLLAQMALEAGMSPNANFRNFQQQQINYTANRNFVPTLQLLNPFAWSQFIKSIKRGDLKKKD